MMRKIVKFCLAIFAFIVLSCGVWADVPNLTREEYLQTYENIPYNFSIDILRHMAKECESESKNRVSFYNGKSGMEIKINASHNVYNEKIGRIVENMRPEGAKIIRKFGDENVAGFSDFIVECKDSNSYYVYRVVISNKDKRIIRVFIKNPLAQAKTCAEDARGIIQSLIIK
ncbi:hypothetical protein IJT10_01040 [bacterium]|nr:hypothetical protein [bacterium]